MEKEYYKEIMIENLPNFMQNINQHSQGVQQIPSSINTKRPPPGQIIIKLLKTKDDHRILKATRRKHSSCTR